MRRILWCIISLCLILLSLVLLLRFRDDADPLPAPLENVVSHVEGLLSLSPEHAVDAYLTGKDTASYDPDTWFKDED